MKYVKSYVRFLINNFDEFSEGFIYELQDELQRGLSDKELHEIEEVEKIIQRHLMKLEKEKK